MIIMIIMIVMIIMIMMMIIVITMKAGVALLLNNVLVEKIFA